MYQKILLTLFCLLCFISAADLLAQEVSENYFQENTLTAINQTSSGAVVSTFRLDTSCQTLNLSVTDPDNAPQESGKPFIVRVRNTRGSAIKDLSGRLNVTIRARSAGTVPVQFLFRSGDGSSDFRTAPKTITIPAGLDRWTETTVNFGATDFGSSFDPTDIRDMWFYLDRANANWEGNDFYLDHIVIGGAADPAQNSPCMLDGGGGASDDDFYVDYFQADTLTSFTINNSAGRVSTFNVDTGCETVTISVVDPAGAPLPPFNAYQFNPTTADGEDIVDLTENVNVTMRVQSAETVNVAVLLRSGNGTMAERTLRKDFDVPAGLDEWTEVTLTFGPADLDGFIASDLRDVWFYLDRGTENFPGNQFVIDHLAVGQLPDSAQYTPCVVTVVQPEAFTVQFDVAVDSGVFTGVGPQSLTVDYNETCEEIRVSVTDTTNAPLGAFRPLIVAPTNAAGEAITNVEGLTTVYMRVRSEALVPISVLLRSGDGSSAFRTAALTQTAGGFAGGWNTLTFSFSEAELANFDPASFIDLWVYLDRENDNFPGNELFIDYISMGERPLENDNSPCGLPEITVSAQEAAWSTGMQVFPNPTGGQLTVDLPQLAGNNAPVQFSIIDLTGRTLLQGPAVFTNGQAQLNVQALPAGVYLLHLRATARGLVVRRIVKR